MILALLRAERRLHGCADVWSRSAECGFPVTAISKTLPSSELRESLDCLLDHCLDHSSPRAGQVSAEQDKHQAHRDPRATFVQSRRRRARTLPTFISLCQADIQAGMRSNATGSVLVHGDLCRAVARSADELSVA